MAELDPGLAPADGGVQGRDNVQQGQDAATGVSQAGTAGQQQAGSSSRKRPMAASSLANLEGKPCLKKDENGRACTGTINARSGECPVCKSKVVKPPSRRAAKKQKAADSFENATFFNGHPDDERPPGVTAKYRHNYEVCAGNINDSKPVLDAVNRLGCSTLTLLVGVVDLEQHPDSTQPGNYAKDAKTGIFKKIRLGDGSTLQAVLVANGRGPLADALSDQSDHQHAMGQALMRLMHVYTEMVQAKHGGGPSAGPAAVDGSAPVPPVGGGLPQVPHTAAPSATTAAAGAEGTQAAAGAAAAAVEAPAGVVLPQVPHAAAPSATTAAAGAQGTQAAAAAVGAAAGGVLPVSGVVAPPAAAGAERGGNGRGGERGKGRARSVTPRTAAPRSAVQQTSASHIAARAAAAATAAAILQQQQQQQQAAVAAAAAAVSLQQQQQAAAGAAAAGAGAAGFAPVQSGVSVGAAGAANGIGWIGIPPQLGAAGGGAAAQAYLEAAVKATRTVVAAQGYTIMGFAAEFGAFPVVQAAAQQVCAAVGHDSVLLAAIAPTQYACMAPTMDPLSGVVGDIKFSHPFSISG